MSRRTIAITGISGYFGRVLAPVLERDPEVERVIGIDRKPPPDAQGWEKLAFHKHDILEPGLDERISEADVLVHLAFQLWRLPGGDPVDETNIRGSENVFEAAARVGLRKLIFTSSTVGYGLHPDNPIPLTEEHPLRPNPNHYYSRAKAICEAKLAEIERRAPQMVITRLRLCAVVGPRAPRESMAPYVAPTVLVVRNHEPLGQMLHEDDMASALHLALREDLVGAYNATSDEPRSLREVVRARGGRVVALPYVVLYPLNALLWRAGASLFAPEWIDLNRHPFVASNAKLKAAGWSPQYTTLEAYQDLVESFQRG